MAFKKPRSLVYNYFSGHKILQIKKSINHLKNRMKSNTNLREYILEFK